MKLLPTMKVLCLVLATSMISTSEEDPRSKLKPIDIGRIKGLSDAERIEEVDRLSAEILHIIEEWGDPDGEKWRKAHVIHVVVLQQYVIDNCNRILLNQAAQHSVEVTQALLNELEIRDEGLRRYYRVQSNVEYEFRMKPRDITPRLRTETFLVLHKLLELERSLGVDLEFANERINERIKVARPKLKALLKPYDTASLKLTDPKGPLHPGIGFGG